jgi:hypothetical protein
MKRLRAVLRCAYHAFLPPFIERWMTGDVHYYKRQAVAEGYYSYGLTAAYYYHMKMNLRAVRKITLYPRSLTVGDREFHKLD